MKNNKQFLRLPMWMILVIFLVLSGFSSHPQKVDIFDLQQIDIDQDGSPDLTVMRSAFATDQDYIYIYDGAQDMKASQKWQEATDFDDDTWIFDVGGDGNSELIIRFMEESESVAAFLYDDRDGDGRVNFDVSGKNIIIREPGQWTLKVLSDGKWYLPNGYPNQNLRFFFSDDQYTVAGLVDNDHDGVPNYEFWNAYTQAPTTGARKIYRIWVNEGNEIPTIPEDTLFWPFLIAGDRPKIQNKFDTTPIITVDWSRATLDARNIGTNISGYPIEKGYYVSGFVPLILGDYNYLNFENPMAYYDLANDEDSWPELHIRMEYFGPSDPYLDSGPFKLPLDDIRYSWSQSNLPNLTWDYKVGLAGINPVNSTVWIGDFGLSTIPYQDLPSWVSDNMWEWGTLVANEGGGYQSTEGIYEWSATNVFQADASDPNSRILDSQIQIRKYLSGQSDLSPDRFYHNIRTGLRGEFGYLHDKPYLYFSPVDAKLHLRNAIQGVWNIDNSKEIHYANLDRDPYIDQWHYLENGRVSRELNVSRDFMIFSDRDKQNIKMKRKKIDPALFETFPPRDHSEWLTLGDQLAKYNNDIVPGDFETMLSQFNGPELIISGGELMGYRPVEQGFRFALVLSSDFIVEGTDWLDLQKLAPGKYLVNYDGVFHIKPLTPPDLKLSFNPNRLFNELPTEYKNGELDVILRNAGLEDAGQVQVSLGMLGPGQELAWTEPQTVTVLAGESTPVIFPWAPASHGEWKLLAQARLLDHEGAPIKSIAVEQLVEVLPAEQTSFSQELSAFGLLQPWQVAGLVVALLLAAALTAWAFSRLHSETSA